MSNLPLNWTVPTIEAPNWCSWNKSRSFWPAFFLQSAPIGKFLFIAVSKTNKNDQIDSISRKYFWIRAAFLRFSFHLLSETFQIQNSILHFTSPIGLLREKPLFYPAPCKIWHCIVQKWPMAWSTVTPKWNHYCRNPYAGPILALFPHPTNWYSLYITFESQYWANYA